MSNNNFKLLTRDQFRETVFKRDGYKCIVCKQLAVDAHHIIERRLFTNGGYFSENGSSLCSDCHLKAETTELSCNKLRELIGIKSFPLPEHLYSDQEYDKWGNPILSNGMRLKGELYNDPSVQKILKPVLNLFTDKVKYNRTYHLPWSLGVNKDDRTITDLSKLSLEPEVVVTVKLDGENCNLYKNAIHARSIEYEPHPSRNWIKALHSKIAYDIPEGWRLCGENMFAKHSIHYNNLEDYFYLFSIWNENNICLSWDETKEWAELFELKMVPELYRGSFDEKAIKNLYQPYYDGDECEGYVVRTTDSFHYKDFRYLVGKFVREDHNHCHNWKREKIIQNKLK